MKLKSISVLAIFISAKVFAANEIYSPAEITPPMPLREFRGAWITEVAANPDWPSKPGTNVLEQKVELMALLDRAVQLHLNAVILQVRPACDAFYNSPYEPWSEFLTGTQGRAPQPLYDPLAFAIQEAHKRGLELHAWFNPFRASLTQAKSPLASNHISKTHPEYVHKYADQLWLDPGEPAVRDYVLRVVMDVVKRYDVDGVQFDDYFYPYQQKDSKGQPLDFPDSLTWKKYANGLNRDDWRRENINQFIQTIHQNIKAAKPWVKFGVSPFGIWRPGFPAQIKGLDAYAQIYADSHKWLAEGWLDYLAPQLYWPDKPPQQSFSALLNWWSSQNAKNKNLWAGINAAGVGDKFSTDEIQRQIQITRSQSGASGEIFYHLKNLTDNSALSSIIRTQFNQPALPWINSTTTQKPELVLTNTNGNLTAQWTASAGQFPKLWVLQFRGTNTDWTTRILPANQIGCIFPKPTPDVIAVRVEDRYGTLSAPVVLKKN